MPFTRQLVTALLLLLVLAGPAGLIAHHHDDDHGDAPCVACLLLAACVAALPALLALPTTSLARYRLAVTAHPLPVGRHLRRCSPRAPPA